MRRMPFVVIGICTIALSFGSVVSSAAMLRGTVSYAGHHAQALIAAVPVDTVSGRVDSLRAVVCVTGLNGAFSCASPEGPFVLIAWDGVNGAIVEGVTDTPVALVMTPQGLPEVVVASSVSCSCRHWVGNIYTICYLYWWGSSCYLSWGCGC